MKPEDTSILVVDDDVDTCDNLRDILTDVGYHVEVAHDGPSALELVRRRPYDLALLDLRMPGMDGVTLYREIRKLRSDAVALAKLIAASPHLRFGGLQSYQGRAQHLRTPAERAEAKNRIVSTGKLRSSSRRRITPPTCPVAPTTPTFKPMPARLRPPTAPSRTRNG